MAIDTFYQSIAQNLSLLNSVLYQFNYHCYAHLSDPFQELLGLTGLYLHYRIT